jgi:hypothetical protein
VATPSIVNVACAASLTITANAPSVLLFPSELRPALCLVRCWLAQTVLARSYPIGGTMLNLWCAATLLAFEATNVMHLRMVKIASGGGGAFDEAPSHGY